MTDDREDVPRIAIDAPAAWARIRASHTAAARDVFAARLAARTGKASRTKEADDRLREAFEQMLERTFTLAQPNLRVNGRPYDDLADEELQSGFDEGLDRHIWALSDQSLQWDGALARKRREKPGEVRRLVGELLNTQRAADDAEAVEWDALKLDADDEAEAGGDAEGEGDVAETEETVRRAYAIVDELVQSVPRQAERAERLRSVTAEVKALRA